ncbi:MAG TPA: DUF2911 domain-containing protein [Gemmatimonadaceae bacterium]
MKTPPLFVALLIAAPALHAQAIQRPQPSGLAVTQVTLAFPAGQAPAGSKNSIIRIEYGQPHLRGRTMHTPDLVPYDKPWRTGANALTTLTTDVDLTLGGTRLPKGSYALFTLPSASGWKLIIQKSVGQSPTEYSATNDVARVDLRVRPLAEPLESFTMWLIPSTDTTGPARGELRMAWGKVSLSTDWAAR